jgi:hypothetical protein
MAAPTHVDSQTNNNSSSVTSIGVTAPAGLADGDFILLGLQFFAGPGTITPPSGFTLITSTGNFFLYGKKALSEGGTFTTSWVTARAVAAFCSAYRGTNGVETFALAADGGNVTSHVSGSLTTTRDDDGFVLIYTSAGSNVALSPAGTFTERTDFGTGGGGPRIETEDLLASNSAGSKGTYTATSGLTANCNSVLLALASGVLFKSQSEGHSNSANQTVTKPAGVVDGDLLIAVVLNYIGGGGDVTGAPAGWTQFGTTQTWRTGNDSKVRLYYKIASSEGANYTWTGNMGTASWQIYISAYTGVDVANPINQITENKTTTAINPISGTSITPSVNNCLIVTMLVARQGAALTGDCTPPSGYTLEWERADTTFATREEAAELIQTTATATGALSWTLFATQSGQSMVYTIAIAPPSTGFVDASTAAVALTPSGIDEPLLGSAGTELFKFTPSGVDITNLNVGTEDFKLTASTTEVVLTNDVAEEYFDLQPSGVEGPQYELVEVTTVPLKYTPSGLEVQAKLYLDSATEILKFYIDSHECYAIKTPDYSLDVFKRWNMGSPFAHWEIFTISKRWNAYLVDTSFEIPC